MTHRDESADAADLRRAIGRVARLCGTDETNRVELQRAPAFGLDPSAAIKSLRGRGYYKVPSLKGVWYRGPFVHNGTIATLDDWFDPRRLRADYAPTGYRAHAVTQRPVPGHLFGLSLKAEDKGALIAFLRTL